MQYTKDRTKYQGQAYDFIAFDELTHFTYDEYSYLFSRNRPNGPGTRVYMRSTANPGGVGHGWVKERFITAAKPMTTVWEDVDIVFPDGHTERRRKSRMGDHILQQFSDCADLPPTVITGGGQCADKGMEFTDGVILEPC